MTQTQPPQSPASPSAPRSSPGADPSVLSRRRALAGAGAVGALAVAATQLPGTPVAAPVAAPSGPAAGPDTGGGYRLSAHVQRYYQTARV